LVTTDEQEDGLTEHVARQRPTGEVDDHRRRAAGVRVANSFGGQVIADLAARHRGVAECLVQQGRTMDAQARGLPRQAWHWLRDMARERTNPLPLLPDYRDAGAGRVLSIYRHALRDRIEDKLPRIAVPTLVVRGPTT
jgi:2-hydroxy-6-oxonona-2,4-dienedioate hydrolase